MAHDFWIQPARFSVKPGGAVPVTMLIGHGNARERWPGDTSRILRLAMLGPGGISDLKPQFRAAAGPIDLAPRLGTPGVHVVFMRTNHARSELPAQRFASYAKDEGLTPILTQRQRNGITSRPGRELYSRRAKALLRVGAGGPRPDPVATRYIGLSLEIVPERDPYALGQDRLLPVHVVFEGRRLPGALVKLTDLRNDEKPVATAITDSRGRAAFRIPQTGQWLVNVVWSKPLKGHVWADFETTFSSLTFGYD
jgi:uncharacterized GH25 family protein